MIKKALIAAAALFALSAHAGYAQLANPSGFGGTAGNWSYAANAANDKVYGKVIHQAGGLTAQVGGQAVKMPAAYRLAANAPRVAAAVVMAHPGVRLAAGAVGVVAWLASAKLVYDVATGTWREVGEAVPGGNGEIWGNGKSGFKFSSADSACRDVFVSGPGFNASHSQIFGVAPNRSANCWARTDDGRYIMYASVSSKPSGITESCPTGWMPTEAGCVSPALEQPEFVDKLAAQPMPSTVPLELPYPSPLPIEQPSPWINPSPGENPSSQPFRVPTGQPSPVPNTDPQQWKQPYIDIVPAPTPDQPFRVDVKPGEVTSTDPNPAENPKPDAEEKPTEEQDKSLCEKHPEIAACEKVEVTDKPLPDQPKLYEPKYPDGITGLWNSKLQEIKATPLFNLAPSLLPNVSAGSCPSWKIDLSIEGWTNAGLQDVSPPCWVWDVAKLVIIASALLLARRLIFGG